MHYNYYIGRYKYIYVYFKIYLTNQLPNQIFGILYYLYKLNTYLLLCYNLIYLLIYYYVTIFLLNISFVVNTYTFKTIISGFKSQIICFS